MANLTRGIRLSKISPKFLHSNATSHTGPFSAIAELIDNAYDPDVSAKELQINKCIIQGKPCLVIQDDGAGMDSERLLKMLSFGFCDKAAFENNPNHLPIGHYGNGFKSGSMRLGKDALVFTVCENSASVGFLSQTYLETIGADCVFVPLIDYRLPHLERFKSQESRNNLDAIMKYSPFQTEQDLKAELNTLCNRWTGTGSKTGTKIVIYNLRRHQDGTLELDFESDPSDIRNPEAHEVDLTSVYHRTSQVDTSEYMRSLRVYCSILFLRPRMKIYIREHKVKTQLIYKSLSSTEIDVYKPTWLKKPLRITFGFSTEDRVKEDYGVMFYHRNRLIKAYEKVGYQKQPNDLGTGVVGVVQADFLKPIHNKQDFEKDEKYNAFMSSLGQKLNDYWNEKNGQKEKNASKGSASTSAASRQLPDWLWVQCEKCLKWRRMPDDARSAPLPDQWLCYMNPDPTHNRCDIDEEPEDEDEAVQRPSYTKTFKKQQEEKKRRKQAEIAAKEEELKAREAALLEAQKKQQRNEVSSSEQSRDLASLQRALLEARKREIDHQRLIVKIQHQKKQVENQRSSLVQAAENLQHAQTSASELLETASSVAGESPVSSTSGKPAGSRKRRSESTDGVVMKVMNLTTDQGDTVTIEKANSDDDGDNEETALPEPASNPDVDLDIDPATTPTVTPIPTSSATTTPRNATKQSTSTRTSLPKPTAMNSTSRNVAKQRTSTPKSSRQSKSQVTPSASTSGVIDLTLEDENCEADSASASDNNNIIDTDTKPDVDQLNKQIAESRMQENDAQNKNSAGQSSDLDASVKVKDEDAEKYTELRQRHRVLSRRMKSLQRNVHKLLSFIVPDVDLGPPEDIEHIVTEMIRVNCNKPDDS